jgi:hypothetical protein
VENLTRISETTKTNNKLRKHSQQVTILLD